MSVLLTGASGFIGRYVLRALQQHGLEVVAVGRTRPHLSVPFIEADLLSNSDLSLLIKQARATHLLHLGWYAEKGKYWTSPLNLRWQEATTRLVETFCSAGGQQVVVAGTCAEFDWSQGYCRVDSPLLNPVPLFGTSKAATRHLVKTVSSHN